MLDFLLVREKMCHFALLAVDQKKRAKEEAK